MNWAAECSDGVTQLAAMGWPGVAALGLVIGGVVAFVWVMNR